MERRKFLKCLIFSPLLLLIKPEKSEAVSPLLTGEIGRLDGMRMYDPYEPIVAIETHYPSDRFPHGVQRTKWITRREAEELYPNKSS